ncbi:MAG: CPBP family intramembrane metalloprotease [Anaerolineaceae bacterium]|nr:CPBP family intramembrane metalloprotease [Anaerolineaceae bacterium]
MKIESSPKNKIITFLFLMILFSSIFYYFILSAGSLQAQGGLYVLGLMWCPGAAGMITQLLYERTLRGLGWKFGKFKYLAIAYLLPIGYCLISYGITWISGLGHFPNNEFVKIIQGSFPAETSSTGVLILLYILMMATLGLPGGIISGIGEEIGWRGFFVPELCKVTSYTKAMFISGIVWMIWHMPLIFFSDYNLPGVPKIYAAAMFTLLIIGISFAFGWLRMVSGSLWPAAILHASHNLFVQNVFTPLTEQTTITPYIIDEFGAGLTLMGIIIGIYFWRKGKDLPNSISTIPQNV